MLKEKFTIYTAEKFKDEEAPDASHSRLYLIASFADATGKHRIHGRIDFYSNSLFKPRLVHEVKSIEQINSNIPLYLEDLKDKTAAVVSEERDAIMHLWEKACVVAEHIGNAKLNFTHGSPQSYNCRAGVVAVLKKLGLEFKPINITPLGMEGTEAKIEELPKIKQLDISNLPERYLVHHL